MPRRAGTIFRPDRRAENSLVARQRQITKALRRAQDEQAERDALAMRLFNERGYTQRRLAELLSVGSVSEGGPELTEDAVQKALSRMAIV